MIEVATEARSPAAPARVFALLKDGSTWPRWSFFRKHELERPGPEDPNGVGAIRVFRTAVSAAHEEIVEIVPDRRLSYVLMRGLPLKDYRAQVDLDPQPDGGTLIRWRSTFRPAQPWAGWFWRAMMRRVLATIARQLAAAAAA